MSTEATRFAGRPGHPAHRESLDEQARRRGIVPVAEVADMANFDIFDTDAELAAFLGHVYAERHANLV
ncbi:hypothetical protein O7635_03850 [Asanoa sp. WMMD1127]|uniref:hypothetical protein n=1 Tax=Asanoa sp. WMMD1127 TaxID=3016107 RepID=UPI0024170B01|nr:hypothetical protein [Asanoa sp. WMMD1127]MDG4820987.1 hypothetical protein [Asanoa sp. WMMD1127]